MNTIDKNSLPDILKDHGRSPIATEIMTFRSLQSILDEFLPAGQKIDLLTIDGEGADEAIIMSNNWRLYRPRLIVLESCKHIYECIQSTLDVFLIAQVWRLGGYSRFSYVFVDLTYNDY